MPQLASSSPPAPMLQAHRYFFALRLDRLSIGARTAALRPAKAIPALRTLQAAIAHEMKRAGAAMRPDWQFHPHLTLRYRADTPSQRAVDDFGWAVEGFVLLESLVGLSRHVLRGRWPLRAVPDPQGALFAD